MGQKEVEEPPRKHTRKPSEGPLRRSSRIHSQAKPNPGLIAAKKNAQMKMGNKTVFSFVQDVYQVARDAKDSVRMPTGVVFDNKMTEHKCLWDSNYPECPERLTSILQRCEELGLMSDCQLLEPRKATEEELLGLHSPEAVSLLKSTTSCTDSPHLESLSSKYDSIYIHPSTYDCSLLAAGSTISLVDEICNKKVQNGMAFVRPPGHHAMTNEYCGYCFFNNVALGAHHALSLGLKRILIVDWDVHHGQATQRMFYNDPRVLYFSIHRYENGSFWPNLRESDFDQVGEGDGRGYNFNVPLNRTGLGNSDYMAVFTQLLLRVAYEFQPELIIVSAGYDAAVGCPEYCPELVLVSAGFDSAIGDEKGEMEVTPALYAHLVSLLMPLAGGKIAVVLEGGYCLKSLAESAALTLRALLGQPAPAIGSLGPPSKSMETTILNVIYSHREMWKCFRDHPTYSVHEGVGSGGRSGEGKGEGSDSCDEEIQRHLPQITFRPPSITVQESRHSTSPGSLNTSSCISSPAQSFETRNCYAVHSKNIATQYSLKIDSLIKATKLFSPKYKVCFVYDTKMMEHKNYEDRDHIEKPSRISSIYKFHEEYGLLPRLHILNSRTASIEEISYAHSKSHVAQMAQLAKFNSQELIEKKQVYHSVYLHQDTFRAASLAAGSLLQVVDSVLTGQSGSGVAVVRPPGHHADIDEPCGFCIFNNVAIAAHYAIKVHNLKRVLIVDWDVHHGNGTQEIFLEDPNVLYLSIHRFDNGTFFPNTGDGAAERVGRGPGEGFTVNVPWNKETFLEDPNVLYLSIHRFDNGTFFPNTGDGAAERVGRGPGEGFTVNVPWNKAKMGNGDYVAAFFQVVLPIAYQFDPELVLVSAGFDAAVGDPLGGCKVTPECFGHMTSWLMGLAGGRLILALEGGYNIHSISYSMTCCTKALLGDPLPPLKEGLATCSSAAESLREVIAFQSVYWSALSTCQAALPVEDVLGERKQKKGSHAHTNNNVVTPPKNADSLAREVGEMSLRCGGGGTGDQRTRRGPSEGEEGGGGGGGGPNSSSGGGGGGGPSSSSGGGGGPSSSSGGGGGPSSSSGGGGGSGQGHQQGASGSRPPTLSDFLRENLDALVEEDMFAVIPLRSCPHLPQVAPVPGGVLDSQLPCSTCGDSDENWVCLSCYTVECGRHVNGHMMEHHSETNHPLTLSFSDLSVWCYLCESYIDNQVLYPARNAAHISKFGSDLAWSYGS